MQVFQLKPSALLAFLEVPEEHHSKCSSGNLGGQPLDHHQHAGLRPGNFHGCEGHSMVALVVREKVVQQGCSAFHYSVIYQNSARLECNCLARDQTKFVSSHDGPSTLHASPSWKYAWPADHLALLATCHSHLVLIQ